jgi:2-methylcitrate dehydratase PrpD
MEAENVTKGFATALHAWPADEPAVRDLCRLLLIDGIAVAAAGAREAGPTIMAELARGDGGAAVATVIGHGFATSAAAAARVNGLSMHVLDYEPMWNPPNHALSPLLPALLAKAEQRERDGAPPQGERLLRALAKGVEAQGRLRVASRQIEPHALRFHPPGVVGPLAAAAGCSELLGLDVEQLAMALAIAGSCGAGIIGNIGSMTKALHCGNAAMRGLECADLAARGFTGDADALGGPRGYGRAYFGDEFDPAPLVAPVQIPRVVDPGMAWKLFPSQYATHFTISAALDCRKAIKDPGTIEGVTVTTPAMAYVDRPRPASGLAGKFSFQYGVAAALLDGKLDMDSFSDQRRFGADMEAMLSRIVLTFDKTISGRLDRMHVDVAVRLRDGSVIERRCLAPEGSWSRPVEPERIRQKARVLLDRCLSAPDAKEFWRCVDADPAEIKIAELMAAVRKTQAAA